MVNSQLTIGRLNFEIFDFLLPPNRSKFSIAQFVKIFKSFRMVSKLSQFPGILTLIREFLGPSPSVFSGKKSRIIASDVTVRTKKIKILCVYFMCVYTVSVRLSYDVNFNWHIPICVELCRAEQKYMPFLGPSPSALSVKNSKAQRHI